MWKRRGVVGRLGWLGRRTNEEVGGFDERVRMMRRLWQRSRASEQCMICDGDTPAAGAVT